VNHEDSLNSVQLVNWTDGVETDRQTDRQTDISNALSSAVVGGGRLMYVNW